MNESFTHKKRNEKDMEYSFRRKSSSRYSRSSPEKYERKKPHINDIKRVREELKKRDCHLTEQPVDSSVKTEKCYNMPSVSTLKQSNEDPDRSNTANIGSCSADKSSRCSDKRRNDDSRMVFDWHRYKATLCNIFFRDKDVIQRGKPDYYDFWTFLDKYEAYQRKDGSRKSSHNTVLKNMESKLGLPINYDKRYRINFSLMTGDMEELLSRVPMDVEEDHLPREKVAEFRYILLLYLDFRQKQSFLKLKKLRHAQNSLPMAYYKEATVSAIRQNQVVLVAGDTGCGKSTQVPRYLLEAEYENIACTQPRRLACISLCKRVAYETLNEYGSNIGFQIRFEKSKTQNTKVLFVTEGLLLRQVATDPLLSMYNVIIVDEVHERHLHGDFLLGIIKCLIQQRADLKVILMSATINIDLFRDYFWGAPVIQVPGRLYPIKVQYRPVSIVEQANRSQRINPAPYIRILQMIDEKYPNDERGDLLIFLSGMAEITTVVEAAQLYSQQTRQWIVLPLHSTLSIAEQDKVFDIAPDGTRKCIVSTNIAETSITIDGIRFVVDSGKVKEMNYDASCKLQKLQEFWISKASAEQRKGRAGRTGPGICFRLYAESDYSSMEDYSTPEIHRVPLDSQILQMISLGIPNVRKFPFIEPPSSETIEESIRSLKDHAAITDSETLTSTGRMLSNLPVDISIGKILIMGSIFDKIGPVLSLSAVLSVQSPFTNRSYRDADAVSARKSLESDHGDPFTLLMIYNEWLDIKANHRANSKHWCKRHGLEEQRFYETTKLRKQFEGLLKDSRLLETNNEKNLESMSGAERSQRHGELKQLREMKRKFHYAPKKRKILKLEDTDDKVESEDEVDIKDIEFKIQHDKNQVKELSRTGRDFTYRDLLILKIILCSGLYPQFAIADEHNSYKPGSDQLFHTKVKPFVILHPMGIFANQPEVLQLNDSDIIDHPTFKSRQTISSKHQLVVYVSLLETTKPYLVNTMRCPAIQSLLLFSQSVDTNCDFSRLVFDAWLEVRFPEAECSQDLATQAITIRKLWDDILQIKLQKKECNSEQLLVKKLIAFLQEEVYYTIRRLLAADVKELYVGPHWTSRDCSGVPQSPEITPHPTKGGFRITDYLTYDCLRDEENSAKKCLQVQWSCPFCEQSVTVGVIDRIQHLAGCREALEMKDRKRCEDDSSCNHAPHQQNYFCDECQKTLYLSSTGILKHVRAHQHETD